MKTYKSKISWGLIVIPTLFFVGIIVYMIITKEKQSEILSAGVVFFFILLFIYYLFTNTVYTINNRILYVKCGFLYRKHLDISRIKSVRKTNDIISAPAASIDRLQIAYDEFGILIISPKNKEGFIKELLSVNPQIIDRKS